MGSGQLNQQFLKKIGNKTKAIILSNIAQTYGINEGQALEEVTDPEAYNILEYMSEPERSATLSIMRRRGFAPVSGGLT